MTNRIVVGVLTVFNSWNILGVEFLISIGRIDAHDRQKKKKKSVKHESFENACVGSINSA